MLGAWRWLAAYDLGVVAEISADEAFRPLRYLSVSFAVIGGIAALSLVAAFMSAFLLTRLSRQFGRVQLTPTTVLINKRGEIVKRYVGEPDFAALHGLVEKLLAES